MAVVPRFLPVLLLAAACADDTTSTVIQSAQSATAAISVQSSSTSVTLSSDSKWDLVKTGSLSGNTVTWTITATKIATVSGQLVLQGQMTVKNTGSGPATIGNIVVNLQARANNTWKSVSVDVANATLGDDATTALIHKAASSEGIGKFVENMASGTLEFMDASDNTVFSLTPAKIIDAGQTTTLLFQATFDNIKLGLVPGTPIRAETIVTFGNASVNGNSTPNLDIDGNGTLSWDEAHVRSVPSRLGLTVPNQTNGNTTPTLTDTAADIEGVGVTVSNIVINLGATSGTVTADVTGTGTVTNCAHLTSPNTVVSSGGFNFTTIFGVNEQACSTINVGSTACTPGTPGCAWQNNNYLSYGQGLWTTEGGGLLASGYDAAFSSTFGILRVGTMSTHLLSFNGASNVAAFLPQGATPDVLDASMINPTSSSAGGFAGELVALTLNVAFSDAGITPRVGSTYFGDLRVCGTGTAYDSSTVRQVLTAGNELIAVGPQGAILGLNGVVAEINASFETGLVTDWAQGHLVNGSCP